MSDYLYDGPGRNAEADPDVEALEHLLGGFAHDRELRQPMLTVLKPDSAQTRNSWVAWLTGTIAVAAAVVIALLWAERPAPSPQIARQLQPAPQLSEPRHDPARELSCRSPEDDSAPFDASEPVPPPSPMVRSVKSGGVLVISDNYGCRPERLHGCRLGRVETPSAWAVLDPSAPNARDVDLPCGYKLDVDETRHAHLQVSRGAVTLVGEGPIVWVPAGHEIRLPPDRAPGLPVATTATARLRTAAARFDNGDPGALEELLTLLGEADTGTLWNLMLRTEGDAHRRVRDRLDAIYPPISPIREAVRRGLAAPDLGDSAGPPAP